MTDRWDRVRDSAVEALRDEGEKWCSEHRPPLEWDDRADAIDAYMAGGQYVISVVEAAMLALYGIERGVVD